MREKGMMTNLLTANCQPKVNLFAYDKNLLNFIVFYEEKFNETYNFGFKFLSLTVNPQKCGFATVC